LFSFDFSKKPNIIRRNYTTLPNVLYVSGTWPSAAREEHTDIMFEQKKISECVLE
jgi:hypothetical protein